MIWDYIRDFIVQYITGGVDSNQVAHNTFIGNVYTSDNGINLIAGSDFYLPITAYDDTFGDVITGISFSDWLATTITAVIMVLMVVLACMLVRWIFKLVSSAFLLRR